MMGSAEQLGFGAGTFGPTEADVPDRQSLKWNYARFHSRSSSRDALGADGRSLFPPPSAMTPAAHLSVAARLRSTSSGPEAEARERLKRAHAPGENFGSFDVDHVHPATADDGDALYRQECFIGNFRRETTIHASKPNDVAASTPNAARLTAVSDVAPYVSLIWSLVEAQQLGKARALLALVPDSPEYTRLKNLLSVPATSRSERKDFDRTQEYGWLTKNAKDYAGKWVAVSGDSLVAVADTLRELRGEVKKTQPARVPLLHFVE